MTNVEARIKARGKNFEILVDVDKALSYKKSGGRVQDVVAVNKIFSDVKKGLAPSEKELIDCFGSSDFTVICDKIIRQGEILLPLEYKKKERETRFKQVVDFVVRNAVDPATNRPHTPTRIIEALEKAGINIEDKPIEQQISRIIDKLRPILPLKIESKKLRIKIPPEHTGRAYGLLNEFKEKEEWNSDGSLTCVINLPIGMQMDFYDKLNAITHGASVVEEVKE
jgi:ribosome maturation protein SDO1